jgi:SAM-dependent methyltransferase
MPVEADISRSIQLFRAFRRERADPDHFYRLLAADSVNQVARYVPLDGSLVLDVGGGSGYFTNAFRTAGARCVLIEPELRALSAKTTDFGLQRMSSTSGRQVPTGSIVADGYRLPFADSLADVSFSSNVLEHVAEPTKLISEMVRVTRPGGVVYVSFTNWYSPWGGHETSPWHYLGGQWALKRHVRATGRVPVNRFGENLFAVHVGSIARWARASSTVEVLGATPRYHPSWCSWIVRVPGLREIATWNLLLILRRVSV